MPISCHSCRTPAPTASIPFPPHLFALGTLNFLGMVVLGLRSEENKVPNCLSTGGTQVPLLGQQHAMCPPPPRGIDTVRKGTPCRS